MVEAGWLLTAAKQLAKRFVAEYVAEPVASLTQ